MNIKDDFILNQINEGYLVGGSVRDLLMEKSYLDRDIAIKNAYDFARMLEKRLNATFIELDAENKIYRLVLEDKINYLDISEIQGENIEEDDS
jgi:tRNA nucleotidyltransferase/poly(A) polymerase